MAVQRFITLAPEVSLLRLATFEIPPLCCVKAPNTAVKWFIMLVSKVSLFRLPPEECLPILASREFLPFCGGNWERRQWAPLKRQPSSWCSWNKCLKGQPRKQRKISLRIHQKVTSAKAILALLIVPDSKPINLVKVCNTLADNKVPSECYIEI